jgi:uncharacterized protein YjiS (DUF1127 family)
MERAMRNDSHSDHRRLTPEQWAELSHRVAREAHAARAQCLRTSLRALFGVLRRPGVPTGLVAAAAREWWTAYGTWLERRRAVRALGALDDRSLKDMGLHRSEIEAAVLGQSSAPPPPRGAAPVSVQAREGKRKGSVAREPKRLVHCPAAA